MNRTTTATPHLLCKLSGMNRTTTATPHLLCKLSCTNRTTTATPPPTSCVSYHARIEPPQPPPNLLCKLSCMNTQLCKVTIIHLWLEPPWCKPLTSALGWYGFTAFCWRVMSHACWGTGKAWQNCTIDAREMDNKMEFTPNFFFSILAMSLWSFSNLAEILTTLMYLFRT